VLEDKKEDLVIELSTFTPPIKIVKAEKVEPKIETKEKIEPAKEIKPQEIKEIKKTLVTPKKEIVKVTKKDEVIEKIVENNDRIVEKESISETRLQDNIKNETIKDEKIVENQIITHHEDNIDSYLKDIYNLIFKYKKYPIIAKKRGLEGECIVSFTLCSSGEIRDLKVDKSSGFTVLDSNSLDVIKEASVEFPKPPKDISISIPIGYKLN